MFVTRLFLAFSVLRRFWSLVDQKSLLIVASNVKVKAFCRVSWHLLHASCGL